MILIYVKKEYITQAFLKYGNNLYLWRFRSKKTCFWRTSYLPWKKGINTCMYTLLLVLVRD